MPYQYVITQMCAVYGYEYVTMAGQLETDTESNSASAPLAQATARRGEERAQRRALCSAGRLEPEPARKQAGGRQKPGGKQAGRHSRRPARRRAVLRVRRSVGRSAAPCALLGTAPHCN